MQYEIKEDKNFQFIEEGNGEPLILLHGLFGALSNFADLLEHFKKTHKVIIPLCLRASRSNSFFNSYRKFWFV